jgi:hypothetical protein
MTQAHSVRARRVHQVPVIVSGSFEITYAAHTATCTFLLDSEGICRRIVATPASSARSLRSKTRDTSSLVSRCVGAQYVASLDPNVPGMLAEKPRVGSSMLFARVDDRGRISLVRTGAVTRFEKYQVEDPFKKSELPSMSVETSAPVIEPSAPTPRFARQTMVPGQSAPAKENALENPRALKDMSPGALLRLHAVSAHDDDDIENDQVRDDEDELARTCEYQSHGTARKTWPSAGGAAHLEPPALPTLRQPPAAMGAEPPNDEDEDAYAAPAASRATTATAAARGPLPRPSLPVVSPPRMRSERVTRNPEPVTPRAVNYPVAEKIVRRR